MAQIVIDIPDKTYKAFMELISINLGRSNKGIIEKCLNAIKHGKVLPKGHGRIGDLDALRCENTDFDTYNDYCTMFDEIEAAETIIEADKAESEDE